jgi:ubiquinone/menaquinone biosynthesis C-methylase UbiE
MTELELIIDLHKNAQRQGPGSEADTLRALNFLEKPDRNALKVADIGCGSGGQTLTLAKNLNAHITAVDLFPEFLSVLNEKAQSLALANKIVTLEKSMDYLLFQKNELDLIWSEGAIYNLGFENGLKKWKDYLKVGGYLAVSEITWITNSRPTEIEDFWKAEYPEVATAALKIKQLEKHGFTLAGYFYLPPESWLATYYQPLQSKFKAFLKRHSHSKLAQKVVTDSQAEIDLYQRFKDYYSYGFYVAQKN